MKLLEEHHEKLARLIKFRSTYPVPSTKNSSEPQASIPAVNANKAPQPTPDTQSVLPTPRPARDLGSSIASNLASARGIPTNRQRKSGQASSPTVNQQNAEGKIVNPPRKAKLTDVPIKPVLTTPLSEKTTALHVIDGKGDSGTGIRPNEDSAGVASTKSDDPFNRFYATFESLFSRLSAPLAFAGLPLTADSEDGSALKQATSQKPATQVKSSQRPKPKTRATASPEYSRLFSSAAIRALRDEGGAAGLNTTESFYVVPTSGGTIPYSNILGRHSQHQKRADAEASREDEDLSDEFVDARETPGNSPRITRKGVPAQKSDGGKTLEELELENTGLRSICDELSRRLWQFEVSSQMSQQALHQSIRAGLQGSPAASEAGGGGGPELGARLKDLEKEMGGLKKENEKLKGVVGKYRERWERLKEGAKMRRENTGGTDKGGGQKEDDE